MAYLMGIDVGTSSVKAYIMDASGEEIGLGSRSYDIEIPRPGYAEQSCEMLWRATVSAVRQALEQSAVSGRDLSAVGVTGQMHGLALLDRSHAPIRPAVIWADHRSSEQVEYLKRLRIEKRVGNPIATGFFLPSLLWVKEKEPERYAKVRYALLPKDYVRFQLCGEIGTERSDASGTLLFDFANCRWDQALAESLGIAYDWLPRCHDSLEIAGAVTARCAEETGLAAGTPVIYGGGDSPMQLVGNGVIRGGQLATNIGTASQLNCVCDTMLTDDALRLNTFHHIPRDQWLLIGASLNGGIVLKWMQKNILTDLRDFEQMSACAQTVPPGSDGVVFLPFINGERSPYMDEHAKGVLFGLQLQHTKCHVIRAGMESVIYSFRDCMRVLEEMGIPLGASIIASGGGARSRLWLQMQADVLKKEIYVTRSEEKACKGAAIAAGVGCGLYDSLQTACAQTVRLSDEVFTPDPSRFAAYDDGFAVYTSLYANNRALFRA